MSEELLDVQREINAEIRDTEQLVRESSSSQKKSLEGQASGLRIARQIVSEAIVNSQAEAKEAMRCMPWHCANRIFKVSNLLDSTTDLGYAYAGEYNPTETKRAVISELREASKFCNLGDLAEVVKLVEDNKFAEARQRTKDILNVAENDEH